MKYFLFESKFILAKTFCIYEVNGKIEGSFKG